MRTIVDLGTFIPGFCDAEGEMVEMDEDGTFHAPCGGCGKDIASRCAYDVVVGRRCNECCSAPYEGDPADYSDPEIEAMVRELMGEIPQE